MLLLALCCGLLAVPAAQAGEVPFAPQDNDHPTAKDGWQAGTCKADVGPCSVDTPNEFYETAAGHPPVGFTQFIIKHTGPAPITGYEEPEVNLKDLQVDLPIGLSVNPGAVPRCTSPHPVECGTSQPLSKVGESQVTVSPELSLTPPITITAPVYNLEPKPGQPARFGFTVEAIPGIPVVPASDIYLEAEVASDSDFHEGFRIAVPKVEFVKLLKNRLVFNGEAHAPGGQGFFLTAPSTCWNPNTDGAHKHTYSTYARGDSKENPDPNFPAGSPFVESPLPPGTFPKDCASIPFEPTVHRRRRDQRSRLAGCGDDGTAGADRKPERAGNLDGEDGQGDAAAGDGLEPVGCQRPRLLHAAAVRQGHQEPGRLPGELEDRDRDRGQRGPARPAADRRRLRR
jgi:hypothetical protein